MPRIRCVMMQKNESTLLEPWVAYHGALFGHANLDIIDNGSTDPHVLAVLERAEQQGCTVHRGFTAQEDFVNKGEIAGNIIRGWDAEGGYDFALPMDCDEFIVWAGREIDTSPARIQAHFERLAEYDATFMIDRMLLNVPEEPGFFLPQTVPKGFFRSHTITHLDHGFHQPVSKHPNQLITQFAFLHCHSRSFESVQAFARQKLAPFVDVDDFNAVRNYQGPGEHLKAYFFFSEDRYYSQYQQRPNVYFPQILDVFDRLSVDWTPFLGAKPRGRLPVRNALNFMVRTPLPNGEDYAFNLFDQAVYLDRHSDIRQAGMWPLLHFITHGWQEDRIFNDGVQPLVVNGTTRAR